MQLKDATRGIKVDWKYPENRILFASKYTKYNIAIQNGTITLLERKCMYFCLCEYYTCTQLSFDFFRNGTIAETESFFSTIVWYFAL